MYSSAPGSEPQSTSALLSTQSLPERVYNLSYSAATKTLLVSMAHRRVTVFHLPDLVAGGDNSKPQSERESALKFLTRSVACMADGKGMFGHFANVGAKASVADGLSRLGIGVDRGKNSRRVL